MGRLKPSVEGQLMDFPSECFSRTGIAHSPPSEKGIQVQLASGKMLLTAFSISEATSIAVRLPLNESGIMSTFKRVPFIF